MATTFKALNPADITSTRTLLHEAIPVTGTIISGTYADNNIKTFAHGMFQSVYDYPYLSSSANHIFDITAGFSTGSLSLSGAAAAGAGVQISKKVNIYNQMAQVLVGFDELGRVRRFDQDGNLFEGNKIDNAFFINFARLLTKDEIKKGSFQMSVYTGSSPENPGFELTIYDASRTKYLVNSPAGEYTLLHSSAAPLADEVPCGLLYYQAGVVVLTASVFGASGSGPDALGGLPNYWGSVGGGVIGSDTTAMSISGAFSGSTIDNIAGGLRNRIKNIQFNNTTELNSTIYFCRVNHGEFNYSSNPTYLSESTIRVKDVAADIPISYVTKVGLYSAGGELCAVGALSEPLRKDSNNEFTIRVRLDY